MVLITTGNILVSKDCQLRITDFGLARYMHASTLSGANETNPMTEYVVTRWYRPPELLLAPTRPYSEAIDLWSIGCILAELVRRKPLFPGKSHANQVQLIFEVVGYACSPRGVELGFPITDEAVAFLEKRCRCKPQPLAKVMPDASKAALALLAALLQVDPSKRPSAASAHSFEYAATADVLHNYADPAFQLAPPPPDFFDFERENFTCDQLKCMIREEGEQRPLGLGGILCVAASSTTSSSTSPTTCTNASSAAVSPSSSALSARGDRERESQGQGQASGTEGRAGEPAGHHAEDDPEDLGIMAGDDLSG